MIYLTMQGYRNAIADIGVFDTLGCNVNVQKSNAY